MNNDLTIDDSDSNIFQMDKLFDFMGMTPRRREMKAESQRADCKKGYDYDHNTGKCVLASHNRGGTQSKDKKDGTKAE